VVVASHFLVLSEDLEGGLSSHLLFLAFQNFWKLDFFFFLSQEVEESKEKEDEESSPLAT